MRWTIRRKLTLYVSLPLLLTYVVLLTWDFYRQANDARALMQDLALERADQLAAVYSGRLDAVARVAESVATGIASHPSMAPGQVQAGLVTALRHDSWIVSAAVVDAGGPDGSEEPVGYLVRREGMVPRPEILRSRVDTVDSDWYSAVAADHKVHWIGPRDYPMLGSRPVISCAVPILQGDQLWGVAAMQVPVGVLGVRRGLEPGPGTGRMPPGLLAPPAALATLPASAGSSTGVPRSLSALQPLEYAILTSEGQLVYRSRPASDRGEEATQRVRRVDVPKLAGAVRDAAAGKASVVRLEGIGPELGSGDSPYWVAFSPIPATGWVFASAVPEREVMQPLIGEIARRGAVLLLGMVVLGGIVYVVAVRISRPIEQMAHVARRVSQGDLSARVAVGRGRDELAQLGAIFNAMVQHIHMQIERIRAETAAREAVEGELRIARGIQADLLPRTFPPFPDHKEFELHAMIVPARQVAGDFFDFFFTGRDCLTLVIADVAGKGVPAALLMAVTRTIVRNLATEGLSPVEIVRRTNEMLVEDSRDEMFVTMFLAQYQPSTGTLTYVNAGHPSPLRLLPDGRCSDYGGSTAPLVGVLREWPGASGAQATCRLELGEMIVLYTDGVTEAADAGRRLLGTEGLIQALASQAGGSAEVVCRHVVDIATEYQAGPQGDDITVMVLKQMI